MSRWFHASRDTETFKSERDDSCRLVCLCCQVPFRGEKWDILRNGHICLICLPHSESPSSLWCVALFWPGDFLDSLSINTYRGASKMQPETKNSQIQSSLGSQIVLKRVSAGSEAKCQIDMKVLPVHITDRSVAAGQVVRCQTNRPVLRKPTCPVTGPCAR